jgi:hypothetical protein
VSPRRPEFRLPAVLLAVLMLAACRAPQDEIVEVYVPSDAEARAAADQRITPENADQEFDELLEEIEGDG